MEKFSNNMLKTEAVSMVLRSDQALEALTKFDYVNKLTSIMLNDFYFSREIVYIGWVVIRLFFYNFIFNRIPLIPEDFS